MNEKPLTIEEHGADSPSACLLILSGYLTTDNVTVLEQKLKQVLDAGKINITMHMGTVKHFSSSSIRVALSAYKEAKRRGGRLKIINPSEHVEDMLVMTGLKEMMG